MWLLGKVMFTENHVNTISARYIPLAREIANATEQDNIRQRSWGSAVLAATYRALCNACVLTADRSALLGCPLFLQLWSWERFSIGRPVISDAPLDMYEIFDAGRIDMPTFGTIWTRRQVCVLSLFLSLCILCMKLTYVVRRDAMLLHRRSKPTSLLTSSLMCTLRWSGSRTRRRSLIEDTPAVCLLCAHVIKVIG
jgi:Plant mobile domain